MILEKNEVLKVEKSNDFKQSNFKINASAQAFSILSSSLYQDKQAAVIRELSANCLDAHVLAEKGVKDKVTGEWIVSPKPNQSKLPFDVTFPTYLNPTLKFRDYGVGLSEDDVFELYTTYFGSTKQDSNDYVGALGLGSKSPFAITTTFMVVSFFNGVKTVYTAMIGDEGFPQIIKMHEEFTNEANGLEISINVPNDMINQFVERARNIYAFFPVKPNIKGQNIVIPVIEYESKTDEFGYRKGHSYAPTGAIQGTVCYQITTSALTGKIDDSLINFYKAVQNKLDLFFKIGDVDIAPSREVLSYTDKTIAAIKQRLSTCIEVIAKDITDSIANEKTYVNALAKAVYWNSQSPYVTQYLTNKNSLKWKDRDIRVSNYGNQIKFEHAATIKSTYKVTAGVTQHHVGNYKPPFRFFNGNGEDRKLVVSLKTNDIKTLPNKLISHYDRVYEYVFNITNIPDSFVVVVNDDKVPLYKLKQALSKEAKLKYNQTVMVIEKDNDVLLKYVLDKFGMTEVLYTSAWDTAELQRNMKKICREFHPTYSEESGKVEQQIYQAEDVEEIKDLKYYINSTQGGFINPLTDDITNPISFTEMDNIITALYNIGIIGKEVYAIVPRSSTQQFIKAFTHIKPFKVLLKVKNWKNIPVSQQDKISSVVNNTVSTNTNASYIKKVAYFIEFLTESKNKELVDWAIASLANYNQFAAKLQLQVAEGKKPVYNKVRDWVISNYKDNVLSVENIVTQKNTLEQFIKTTFPIFLTTEISKYQGYDYDSKQSSTYWNIDNEKQKIYHRYINLDWNERNKNGK